MEKEDPKNKDISETTDTRVPGGGYSSPPCYAHEWEAASGGPAPFSARDLSDLLSTLLEAERTGLEIIAAYTREHGLDLAETVLQEVCGSGLDNCVLLSKLLEANELDLAVVPDKVNRALAVRDPGKRIEFLVHWYSCIAQRIKDVLPYIADTETASKLKEMYVQHLINITILEDVCTHKPNNV